MTNLSYKGLFEDWEVAVTKKLIDEFRMKWKCLRLDGFDDLLQECLTHWYFVKDKYDPSAEASQKTFMARVLRNKLSDIVKEHERQKRKVFQNSVSLDQPLSDEEDAPTLLDTIPADEQFAANIRFQTELKIELSKVYPKLTPQQQKLCDLLSETDSTITELSEQLGIRRKTVYKEIERIRAIFENEGLKDFLEYAGTLFEKASYICLERKDDRGLQVQIQRRDQQGDD